MAINSATLVGRLHAEIERVPPRHRGALLKIVHAYREAVEEDESGASDIAAALRRSVTDVQRGRVHPIATLWDGVDSPIERS